MRVRMLCEFINLICKYQAAPDVWLVLGDVVRDDTPYDFHYEAYVHHMWNYWSDIKRSSSHERYSTESVSRVA